MPRLLSSTHLQIINVFFDNVKIYFKHIKFILSNVTSKKSFLKALFQYGTYVIINILTSYPLQILIIPPKQYHIPLPVPFSTYTDILLYLSFSSVLSSNPPAYFFLPLSHHPAIASGSYRLLWRLSIFSGFRSPFSVSIARFWLSAFRKLASMLLPVPGTALRFSLLFPRSALSVLR